LQDRTKPEVERRIHYDVNPEVEKSAVPASTRPNIKKMPAASSFKLTLSGQVIHQLLMG